MHSLALSKQTNEKLGWTIIFVTAWKVLRTVKSSLKEFPIETELFKSCHRF